MDRAAEFIHAVPSQRVLDDRRHRAQIRQVRPHALAGGDVGAVYGAGLSLNRTARRDCARSTGSDRPPAAPRPS